MRLSVCLSVRTYDKTKTTETKIAKLGTQIVYYDTSPPMNIRSKVKVKVRFRVRRSSGRRELRTSIECFSIGLVCTDFMTQSLCTQL